MYAAEGALDVSMKHRGTILVCDDDPAVLALMLDILEADGHDVETTSSAKDALARLEAKPYDLLLADLILPGIGGLELLSEAKRRSADTEVIIITGHGDIDSAVMAIKQGAYDYITKPFHPEKFTLDVQKALERKRLASDLDLLRKRTEGRDRLGDLLGRSQEMLALFRLIEQVSATQSTILILGESGTGKEMTAREIHRSSPRRGGPFVTVSCGSLPPALLESELFGHTKGAFTGATVSTAGLFEAASGGTIFLDEIGSTKQQIQVGLLRVLQEREVRRIGSTESRKVDVRVIAATNADLERAMDEGTFRTDLFYRLAGVTLRLPPLRERAEDIPLLAQHFLRIHGERLSRPTRALSPRSVEILCEYHWPGNVRELEHVMEHAALFTQREIVRPIDLPNTLRDASGRGEGAEIGSLQDVEKNHIREVLRLTHGNRVKAARILKIPRTSLYRRIEKYRLDGTNFDKS